MTGDELEARYVRLLTGCLSALRELTELLPPEPEPDPDPLQDIVSHSRFCKLAKHANPQVTTIEERPRRRVGAAGLKKNLHSLPAFRFLTKNEILCIML